MVSSTGMSRAFGTLELEVLSHLHQMGRRHGKYDVKISDAVERLIE